jgi:DNA (cytosine-5)-methyltransferase 1
MLTVGSLFAGIGGFDLGFERAGMRTVWFCEQDPFCQRVLAKHWPGVPCYPDVCALVADTDSEPTSRVAIARPQLPDSGRGLPVSVPYVDILAGGFPCQDISAAGAGAGIDGARSGLWSEYARLIRELRPRYVVVENVAALLGRGIGRVLGDLAACGYDAEWDCIPAAAVGAPHRRDRVWLVAYPQRTGLEGLGTIAGESQEPKSWNGGPLADSAWDAEDGSASPSWSERERVRPCGQRGGADDQGWSVDDTDGGRYGLPEGSLLAGWDGALDTDWWVVEPDVGRVANGVPNRVDRLASLGNALVPQIAEWIGRRIVSYES